VRNVYYPLPPLTIPAWLGDPKIADSVHDPQDAPPPCFACKRCHDIRYFNRRSRDAWNHLVAHLTGGLLYGHEVEKPAWFQLEKRKPYRPQENPHSPRRRQVLARLLEGLTYNQIARDLNIARPTVNHHVKTIYKQHDVHSRRQLLCKLRPNSTLGI
jgi:DNA-binding CsgD family transcriptional regulator